MGLSKIFNIQRIKNLWRGEESLAYTYWIFAAINFLFFVTWTIFAMFCYGLLYGFESLNPMIYNPALIMMIMIVGSAFNGYTNGIIIYLADKFYHKTRWAKVILFLFSLQLSQALDIACIYGSYYVVSLILYGTFFGTAIYRLRGAKSEIHISNKEENS